MTEAFPDLWDDYGRYADYLVSLHRTPDTVQRTLGHVAHFIEWIDKGRPYTYRAWLDSCVMEGWIEVR
jgi:hypothetical protein